MDKNYQQTKGSSAVSNISLSDDSEGSNPENEAAIATDQPKDSKEVTNREDAKKSVPKGKRSQDKMKCIYCWSKKTLTDV